MGRLTTTNPSKDPRPLLRRAPQWPGTWSLAKCSNSAPGRPASTLSTTRAGALLVRAVTSFMIICVSRREALPRLPTRLRSPRPRAAASGRVLSLPASTNLPISLRLAPSVPPIIHSLPAPLAGRPTSPFDWAAPVWDMSPLPALKCSRTTRRRHRPSLEFPVSTFHLCTLGWITHASFTALLSPQLASLGMVGG